MKKYYFYLFFLVYGFINFCFAQNEDTITLITYYPSPYGSYRELSTYQMKIGEGYSQPIVNVERNNLIVEGKVGIGTPNPRFRLDVIGDRVQADDFCLNSDPGNCLSKRSECIVVVGCPLAKCPDGYVLTGGGMDITGRNCPGPYEPGGLFLASMPVKSTEVSDCSYTPSMCTEFCDAWLACGIRADNSLIRRTAYAVCCKR